MAYISDDGTLDTVVVCDRCRCEMRFNYDPPMDGDEDADEDPYETWLDECCAIVDNECGCNEETTDA